MDNLRERCSRADPSGLHFEKALAIDRGPDYLIPGLLISRDRFSSQHRLINRSVPLNNDSVNRYPLARAYNDDVADLDVIC